MYIIIKRLLHLRVFLREKLRSRNPCDSRLENSAQASVEACAGPLACFVGASATAAVALRAALRDADAWSYNEARPY